MKSPSCSERFYAICKDINRRNQAHIHRALRGAITAFYGIVSYGVLKCVTKCRIVRFTSDDSKTSCRVYMVTFNKRHWLQFVPWILPQTILPAGYKTGLIERHFAVEEKKKKSGFAWVRLCCWKFIQIVKRKSNLLVTLYDGRSTARYAKRVHYTVSILETRRVYYIIIKATFFTFPTRLRVFGD